MTAPRRRLLWLLLVPVVAAALYFALRGRGEATQYTFGAVDRGDVVEVVGATGTLEAVTTVQIGSQVSGTIQSLYADFNSQVKKGEVIARLDPAIFQARLGQAEANLVAARANLDRAKATVEDTRLKFERAKELAGQKLVPQSDLDTAKSNFDGAVAAVKAAEAAVSQSVASVNQAKLDLSHTVIDVPIDGVVISRNVDVGQTVAASFTAPVLFTVANDLSRMRVNASIDEADVGRVREGQDVLFHVDAYPERDFWGRVEQVRLNPTTVSNVVTYNTIVAVDNSNLLLRPGMTATVSVQVRKAENALRVPASALRFRPEGFEVPRAGRRGPGGPGGGGGTAAGGASGARPAQAAGNATPPSPAPPRPLPRPARRGPSGPAPRLRAAGPADRARGGGRRAAGARARARPAARRPRRAAGRRAAGAAARAAADGPPPCSCRGRTASPRPCPSSWGSPTASGSRSARGSRRAPR
ncbi:MAG: efflux RND transporter periplasmic adaptor subunit [Vicinamibacteria bacterium]